MVPFDQKCPDSDEGFSAGVGRGWGRRPPELEVFFLQLTVPRRGCREMVARIIQKPQNGYGNRSLLNWAKNMARNQHGRQSSPAIPLFELEGWASVSTFLRSYGKLLPISQDACVHPRPKCDNHVLFCIIFYFNT